MAPQAPFGLWNSPITAELVSQAARLQDAAFDSDGQTLLWLESRSGKGVLMARPAGEALRQLTVEQNVRGGVGYGGGEFALRNGVIVFAARDGRLYRRSLGYGRPQPVTPPFGAAASPAISPDGRWVAYVFSDGETDLIGIVDSEGRGWPAHLVTGADFYMQPAWHPDGTRLAWVEWDQPNMPWNGARLMLGRLVENTAGRPPALTETSLIAGGLETPVSQPEFSPDGRYLSYLANPGEWDELVLLDLQSGERRILVSGPEVSLIPPAWVQGIRSYAWDGSSRRLYFTGDLHRRPTLSALDIETGEITPIDTGPYTAIDQLTANPAGPDLAFIGSSPSLPPRVVRWDGARLVVEARSDPEMVAPEYYPQPQLVAWHAPDGTTVPGWYYAPSNPRYAAAGLPPAIVYIHGGPSSYSPLDYDAQRAYFTSRGYAWLEVNYRGSTGLGKTYRDALKENWGKVDVEDAAGGAQALVQRGLADPARLIIMGGSAGGYTVLNALVRHPGLFKAGICLYGVSNLFTINIGTHKFELSYNDWLVGVLPEAAARFHEWSPVFHASHIRDPLAIFQGSEDNVVPPGQSEEIVAVLRRTGVPHIYRLYEGEGHGFRKSETIADFLQQAELFIQQQVLFAP